MSPISLDIVRQKLSTPLLSDALDGLGERNRVLSGLFQDCTSQQKLVGRCRTSLWAEMDHPDPRPYELELEAVDACQPEDVMVCAAGGSLRSGIWGELLTTAARNRGCVGVLVDGAVRDVPQMREMGFPVFARGTSPRDSLNRQRVIDIDVPVLVGGVLISPGDLVVADLDGVVVVPFQLVEEVLKRALEKSGAENITRDAIRGGMLATEAYRRHGIL